MAQLINYLLIVLGTLDSPTFVLGTFRGGSTSAFARGGSHRFARGWAFVIKERCEGAFEIDTGTFGGQERGSGGLEFFLFGEQRDTPDGGLGGVSADFEHSVAIVRDEVTNR